MVDSGNNVSCNHQPEKETVMLVDNSKQSQQNHNKLNDKQANITETQMSGKQLNNCDNLRAKNPSNENIEINYDDGDVSCDSKRMQTIAVDAFSDDLDEDPYAELQSYLDKVKVS